MRLLILGDIGSSVGFHAGDEAMAEAFVAEMAHRGEVSVTAMSGCVEDTKRRYGWNAVPRFGFGALAGSRTACEERLSAIEAAARGQADAIPWDDSAWQVIDAISGADAIAVTGGGNLSSTWPEHIYERAALALLAGIFAKPFIVSGQTLGPYLLGRDGDLIAQLLNSARLVGVREADSLELLGRLGIPREKSILAIDDATYIAGAVPAWSAPAVPYIAATFAPFPGILGQDIHHDLIVSLLQHSIATTDCDVVLIPHQGGSVDGDSTDDLAFHSEIAAAVGEGRVHQAPMMTSAEIAELTRGASLVISSRYHPIVFGLSGSVPSVGIGVDAYTSTKIKGAMANYGLDSFHVGPGAFAHGDASEAVASAWAHSEAVRNYLDDANSLRRDDSETRWDSAYSALSGESPTTPQSLSSLVALSDGGAPRPNEMLDRWSSQLGHRLATQDFAHAEALRSLAAAEGRIDDLEMKLAAALANLDDARLERDQFHASTSAAQKLAADLLAPNVRALAESTARAARDEAAEIALRLAASERELASLYATRLFRYARGPRAIYARVRRP